LKPWQVKSWVIPEASARFVYHMEQVLDVYARPYDPLRPVVCLDESRKQLVAECRQPFTDAQGVTHVDYEYTRAGVATLYMLTEPLAGWREVQVADSQDRLNWAQRVAYLVEERYPHADCVTLVQDNLSAHTPAALYECFPPQRAHAILQRLEIVSTPPHGSWLNIAEIELSVLTRFGLEARIPDSDSLLRQVQAWTDTRNHKQRGVAWHFATPDARIKLKRLYPSIID
jgi:hypothetical protein